MLFSCSSLELSQVDERIKKGLVNFEDEEKPEESLSAESEEDFFLWTRRAERTDEGGGFSNPVGVFWGGVREGRNRWNLTCLL